MDSTLTLSVILFKAIDIIPEARVNLELKEIAGASTKRL